MKEDVLYRPVLNIEIIRFIQEVTLSALDPERVFGAEPRPDAEQGTGAGQGGQDDQGSRHPGQEQEPEQGRDRHENGDQGQMDVTAEVVRRHFQALERPSDFHHRIGCRPVRDCMMVGALASSAPPTITARTPPAKPGMFRMNSATQDPMKPNKATAAPMM